MKDFTKNEYITTVFMLTNRENAKFAPGLIIFYYFLYNSFNCIMLNSIKIINLSFDLSRGKNKGWLLFTATSQSEFYFKF